MALYPFCRTELLVGEEGIEKLKNSKVIVFGIGGVGSFVVEALTRAGVGNLVLVDNDTVCISNLNRQIHATTKTVDMVKVEAMKERIKLINPECKVEAKQVFVTAENIPDLITDDIDYVVDAIDTVTSKLALAEYCYKNEIKRDVRFVHEHLGDWLVTDICVQEINKEHVLTITACKG